ncbi:hypothetical protein CFIICLFH_3498 [Methylobacterium goesingense]|uniref:Uncharacterized protein n=1 Tax=Methylobacterium goesingense TaxID=243690 RepID=A0ABV2L564_9HYPH|nr:hypothetical protein CFIICLFH_3498 [Methylobacterium goesingense]
MPSSISFVVQPSGTFSVTAGFFTGTATSAAQGLAASHPSSVAANTGARASRAASLSRIDRPLCLMDCIGSKLLRPSDEAE